MMSSDSIHRIQRRPGQAGPLCLLALLGGLGGALAAFQTIQPVRAAYGLDPVVRPATRAVALPPTRAMALPGTRRFNPLASTRGVAPSAQPAPTRRLGAGTRRAVRLAPPAVQVSAVGAVSRSVATMQPVAAAAPGSVQHAKLDQALRRLVGGDHAAPVRVIVRTQPGQHAAIARWLASEGRRVHRLHPTRDGLTTTLSVSDVAALSEDPSIVRLSIDPSGLTPAAQHVGVTDVGN